MPAPSKIVIGRRFGRLTVLKEIEPHIFRKGRKGRRFAVRCDCGMERHVLLNSLVSDLTQSCGCLHRERFTNLTHGETRGKKQNLTQPQTAEYRTWANMVSRCENANATHYKHYGGRGIKVCKRWRESYEAFLEDMGRRPAPHLTIDRINNDGNYEPGNCRWATWTEQRHNQRQRKKP